MTETPAARAPDRPALLASQGERPTLKAMRRGALGRCPACGGGALFHRYLTILDHCPGCGEALHHQRADDGPAYVTILIVSHLLTPLLLGVFVAFRPSIPTMLIGFVSAAIVLTLALLRPIKGAMVGLQWAQRMHGFDRGPDPR